MAARDKKLESIDEAANVAVSGDGEHHCVSDVLVSENAKTALRLLSTFSDDSMTADLLADLSQDGNTSISPEDVLDIIDWADRLGIVRRDGTGYRLDSTYARGLRRVFEE